MAYAFFSLSPFDADPYTLYCECRQAGDIIFCWAALFHLHAVFMHLLLMHADKMCAIYKEMMQNHKVLVYCHRGVQRSACVVIAPLLVSSVFSDFEC